MTYYFIGVQYQLYIVYFQTHWVCTLYTYDARIAKELRHGWILSTSVPGQHDVDRSRVNTILEMVLSYVKYVV